MKTNEYYKNEVCKSIYNGKSLDYFKDLEGESYLTDVTPNNIRTLVLAPNGYCIFKHTDPVSTQPTVQKLVPFTEKLAKSLQENTVLNILTNPRSCSNVEEIVLLVQVPEIPISLNIEEVQKVSSLERNLSKLRSVIVIKDSISLVEFANQSRQLMESKGVDMFADIIREMPYNSSVLVDNEDWYKPSYSLRPKYYALDKENSRLSKKLFDRKNKIALIYQPKRKPKPKEVEEDVVEEEVKEKEPKRKRKVSEQTKEFVSKSIGVLNTLPITVPSKESKSTKDFSFVTPEQAKTLVKFGLVSLKESNNTDKLEPFIVKPILEYLATIMLNKEQLELTQQFIKYDRYNIEELDKIQSLINYDIISLIPIDVNSIDVELVNEIEEHLVSNHANRSLLEKYQQQLELINSSPQSEDFKDFDIKSRSLALVELGSQIINNFAPYLEVNIDRAKTTTSINNDFNNINNSLKRVLKHFKEESSNIEYETSAQILEYFIQDTVTSSMFKDNEVHQAISYFKQILDKSHEEENTDVQVIADGVANFLVNEIKENKTRFNIRSSNVRLQEQVSLRGTQLSSQEFYATGTKANAICFNTKPNESFSNYFAFIAQYLSSKINSLNKQ